MNFDVFPLLLSLRVAFLATAVSFGLGLAIAWWLSRYDFRGKDLVESLVMLPLVLPPTVLGYYLLVAIGRQSFIGQALQKTLHVSLVFTWQGAVVAASVASLPLFIRSAQASLEGIDRNLINVARTLGQSELRIFWRVSLPLAWRGILSGVVLAFTRALGDFGTTLMVAGNIPGRTQTIPIAIYDAVLTGNQAAANVLVLIVTAVAVVVLVSVSRLTRRHLPRSRDAGHTLF